MNEQSGDKFTWLIENFSEVKDEARSPRFTIGGCNWRLFAYTQGDDADPDHLAVYLEISNSKSLPSQWRRRVRFTFFVVNQFSENQTRSVVNEYCFRANERDVGVPNFVPLTELQSPRKGFLVNNSVIIEVKIEVLEVHGNLDITAEGVDVEETSSDGVDAEETSDEPERDSTDCSSYPSVDAEAFEICKEVSSFKNPQEPLGAYETVEADVAKSDDAAYNVCGSIISPSKTGLMFQTIDVNGFLVHDTQADQVKRIFKGHPDIASNFRPKNQKLKTAYVGVLLDLIGSLCQSPQDITEEDLSKGSSTLIDLEDVGLKLDWLKTKFDEVWKRKERAGGARIGKLEKEIEKLKLMMSDLEVELEKEKQEVATVRLPLSFSDFVP